ncbi:hypothetical protein [Streptomyces sp. NPDC002159]
MIAAGADVEAAEDVSLWFDLIQHYRDPSAAGAGPGGQADHLLDHGPTPGDEQMAAAGAILLDTEQIRARLLNYPTQGLVADRFTAGWSAYAQVTSTRIPSSISPQQAQEMFTAEETYVRRRPAGERFMTDLRDEVMRLDSESAGSAGISFTIDPPPR